MKPIIKWPSGKTSELNQLTALLPDFDRYIEPFVGGGALYFALNPPKAVIGDTAAQLMDLYRLLQAGDQELRRLLELYSSTFEALQQAALRCSKELLGLYKLYEWHETEDIGIRTIAPHVQLVRRIASDATVMSDLIPDRERFLDTVTDAVEDKLIRTARNDRNHTFSREALLENILTGFAGGFYLYFRDILNDIEAGRLSVSGQYAAANYYFIRELCYGSMFRYNSKGEFNVPYGGMTYNHKDLDAKIRAMYAPQMQHLLQRTQIVCEDFESLLRRMDLTERDFLFLDPPYDTEFSAYAGNPFGQKDQERLAAFLKETKARFLLVIQNTEELYRLYEGQFRILALEKKKVHNIQSRSHKTAKILIVTNVPEDQVPWIRENYALHV